MKGRKVKGDNTSNWQQLAVWMYFYSLREVSESSVSLAWHFGWPGSP